MHLDYARCDKIWQFEATNVVSSSTSKFDLIKSNEDATKGLENTQT